MMKKIYVLILCCLLITISGVNGLTAFANEKEDDEILGYAVKAIQPSTQLDQEKTYFYVQTVPGEEQTLEVKVQSTRKKPIDLEITVEDAMTGDNGEIAYKASNNKEMNYDETLKEPVSSMIEVETPKLTVGNFEEKIVRFKLTPPKEHYQGVKIGAISIGVADKVDNKGIKTGFSYEIGAIFSETGEEFNNSESLNLKSVRAELYHGKKMVLANLQNPEPKVLENLTIDATVKNKKSGDIIKEKKVQGYTMAPNSNFNFGLDWGIANIPSGVYIMEMEVKNDFNNWTFKKEFQITGKQANEINAGSPYKIITPLNVQIATVTLGVLTVMIAFFQFRRKNKWERHWKKLRIQRKKTKKKRNSGNSKRER
ncbi:hypothetical protein A5821_002033 [Enterococcus sp. 7F3_DIV0205]|uniref:DUF3324 domain-containing protein n=2 Tax=Candidatus Enterococcus palustris TaxID=1834189 RepID=A0AAQ3WA31_9ENTE|nr:hypothetical protein A5821_002383 [Enterococcus sp. 7F3_DIV0205]